MNPRDRLNMIDNNKPSVGILFTDVAKTAKSVPFKSKKYSRVHSIFSKRATKQGLNAFFAYYREYKDGKLMKCWYNHKGRWKLVKDQKVDVVYSRFAASIYSKNRKNKIAARFKYKMAEKVSLVNHPFIDDFCWDKKIIAEMFPEFCPRTFVVNTKKGLKLVLSAINSEKVVIKPRYGTLGKDVVITDKDNLPSKIEKNTIVQEFIDTSNGIKKVTDGLHDMRVVMINGKIDHAHIRIPKRGLLTANVALGGKKIFISNWLVPRKARIMAKKIDNLFKDFYPRVYSVDFLFDGKGNSFIVECNSQPMIDKYAYGKYAKIDFYDRVIQAIKSGINIKATKTIE